MAKVGVQVKYQGSTLQSSIDKRLNPLLPNGTSDIFLSLNSYKEVGVTSHFKVKKPLQMIMFTCKKEAEYSYVTLNNNYNWAFKSYLSGIYLLFEVAFY